MKLSFALVWGGILSVPLGMEDRSMMVMTKGMSVAMVMMEELLETMLVMTVPPAALQRR